MLETHAKLLASLARNIGGLGLAGVCGAVLLAGLPARAGIISQEAMVANPVISPPPGTYYSSQTITITDATPGASIYYLIDEQQPYVLYKGPFQLTEGGPHSLQVYAAETGYLQSDGELVYYTLNLPPAAAPVLSVTSGTYSGPQTVTITDATPGATIYYTTNGQPPSTVSALYSGPVTVSTSETLVATAIAPGFSFGQVAVGQYVIASASGSLIYSVAGTGMKGYSGDDGPGTAGDLNFPYGVARDSAGNLYIADSGNNVVRKVAAGTGILSTFAGSSKAGYSGDGKLATQAELNSPRAVAVDTTGNVYIADSNNSVIRKVAAATGVITTVAGNGNAGFSGDGGPATAGQLSLPQGVVMDEIGNLYIADTGNSRIRMVAANSGVIRTVAGVGGNGYGGDNGPAIDASLSSPYGVAVYGPDFYIADTGNNVIRKVSLGMITTVAGYATNPYSNFPGGFSGDGGPATKAQMFGPESLVIDSSGNLFIADTQNSVIRKVTASTGIIRTVAGDTVAGQQFYCSSYGADGGSASSAALCYPGGMALDPMGNLYVASEYSGRIREVTAPTLPPTTIAAAPTVSVAAGTYDTPQSVTLSDATPGAAIYISLNGAPATTFSPGYDGAINVSGSMTIQAVAAAPGYLISAPISAAYTITSPPAKVISTIAGDGISGFCGSGGQATLAQLGLLDGAAVDGGGNVYFADFSNDVIWKIAAGTGILSIAAGTGNPGFSGDGGLATKAQLSTIGPIAVDASGNLYIADNGNNVIRKVLAASGVIFTYAGTPGKSGNSNDSGDGGPATSALLGGSAGLAVDGAGNLYISDAGYFDVRMVTAATGIITAVAGTTGKRGFSGDGGPATSALLLSPGGLAVSGGGDIYIADLANGRIRKVTASTGIITTVAGNGDLPGYSGDGGPAINAVIDPTGLALDAAGNLYFGNYPGAVREVAADTGIISTVVGDGYFGYYGDGGSATVAQTTYVQGLAFDAAGSLYLTDELNYRVRKVATPVVAATPVFSVPGGTYRSAQTVAITDATVGAAIYYTTDGSTPTTGSALYAGPIAVSESETLSAIATASGYLPSAVASAAYTIYVPLAAAVTVTPAAAIITNDEALSVSVAVTGAAGQATPTGSVTLAGGAYSATQALAAGTASFTIPAGTLSAGANTLTASYGGDAVYGTASGSASVTVAAVTITGASAGSVTPGASATAKVTLNAGSSYSGTLNLTCALTGSPSGAQSLPTCSLNPASVTLASGGAGTSVLTIATTAASSGAALRSSRDGSRPESRPDSRPGSRPGAWLGGGGAMLAGAMLWGFRARRRRWTALLGIFVLGLAILAGGGTIGCGGSGGGSGGHIGPVVPATTAGNYVFTVTGTDASNAKIAISTQAPVTVE